MSHPGLVEEHVVAWLAEYFKSEHSVEHLLDLFARYVRARCLYPEYSEGVDLYLSGWMSGLQLLKERLGEEDEFAIQIHWCLYFLECCQDDFKNISGTRGLCSFQWFATQVKQTWLRLTH